MDHPLLLELYANPTSYINKLPKDIVQCIEPYCYFYRKGPRYQSKFAGYMLKGGIIRNGPSFDEFDKNAPSYRTLKLDFINGEEHGEEIFTKNGKIKSITTWKHGKKVKKLKYYTDE